MLDYKHYSLSTSAFLSLKIFFIYKKKLSLLNLESLIIDVLKGLSGEIIDKILQLRTPFGGGKTHTLVSLYHITQLEQKVAKIGEY